MGLLGSAGLAGGGEERPGSRLSLLWGLLGALVLGALLAKWVWVLFAPRPSAIAAAPEYGASAEAGKLFGAAPVMLAASAVPEAPPLPDVRLVGVFAGKSGHSGFAVLKLDDKRQTGVAAGGEVAPGVRLAEVHPDHVVLERAGVQQRVMLEEKRK